MAESASSTKVTSSGKSTERLSGNMSTFQLVLTVLAFSSPITTMAGYFSLTIMVSGETAPTAFLVTTISLLIFSVGYMALTRRMKKPGAYYAYITAGLGKHVGLGSSYLSTMSYTLILIGVYAFVGIIFQGIVTQFGGPEIPWWIGSVLVVILVGFLGYINVDVSAKVLTWVMVVEVVLMLIFDAAVLFQGGKEGIPVSSFNFAEFIGSEPLIGILFAILVFIGFEATVIYRDEVKNPNKTVPRATYIAVLAIGLLYTFSVWMLVAAFGSGAQEAANQDLGGMFTTAATDFVGVWFADTFRLLLITALIACLISIHNVSTRYLFNISADGGFVNALGKVNSKFKSPSRSSIIISLVSLVTIIAYAVTQSDPNTTYAQLAGLGSAGIIALMVLVSFSVLVWFGRNSKEKGDNIWNTAIAPVVSTLIFGAIIVYAFTNFYLVVGGEPGQLNWMMLLLLIPVIAGVIIAAVLKTKNANRYAQLGGTSRED